MSDPNKFSPGPRPCWGERLRRGGGGVGRPAPNGGAGGALALIRPSATFSRGEKGRPSVPAAGPGGPRGTEALAAHWPSSGLRPPSPGGRRGDLRSRRRRGRGTVRNGRHSAAAAWPSSGLRPPSPGGRRGDLRSRGRRGRETCAERRHWPSSGLRPPSPGGRRGDLRSRGRRGRETAPNSVNAVPRRPTPHCRHNPHVASPLPTRRPGSKPIFSYFSLFEDTAHGSTG